jgi:hypothetical protein
MELKGDCLMTTYPITFNLTTAVGPADVERFAAELAVEARAHLTEGERYELAGVGEAREPADHAEWAAAGDEVHGDDDAPEHGRWSDPGDTAFGYLPGEDCR